MPDIVLATFNARWIHTAFGLRYLLANLGELAGRATLLEFNLEDRPVDAAEAIVALRPRIIALGAYIWNAEPTAKLLRLLKRIQPSLPIVLGGPEVIDPVDLPSWAADADYLICGEGEDAFRELCAAILCGQPPAQRIVRPPRPDLHTLALPYHLYDSRDLAGRTVYVEASRGCPFGCEFCLSCLDPALRYFPEEKFLAALEDLWQRGGRRFKFVDRSFNANPRHAAAILDFFLARPDPELFVHFEMVPEILPDHLQERLPRFAPRQVQLEIGVQTFNAEVAGRIGRRLDAGRVEANLRWLRTHTTAHIHADLIAGLPGETLASFAAGFDRLHALRPHEIQVGLLKRLRGTPIGRHDADFDMRYNPDAPYELLCNRDLDFLTVGWLRRFARYFDLVHNSGRFAQAADLLLGGESAFASFMDFSDWLYVKTGRTHGIALAKLVELIGQYLRQAGHAADVVNDTLAGVLDQKGRTRQQRGMNS